MFKRYNLDVVIVRLIDASNNRNDSLHIMCPIRNDQHVRSRMCGEVAVLRNKRPQDGHELCRRDVFDLDNLGDYIVRSGAVCAGQAGILPGTGVLNDLDYVAAGDCDVAMHLENRQKGLVKCVRRHWR